MEFGTRRHLHHENTCKHVKGESPFETLFGHVKATEGEDAKFLPLAKLVK